MDGLHGLSRKRPRLSRGAGVHPRLHSVDRRGFTHPFALQLCLEAFDINDNQLSHVYVAQPRDNVLLYNPVGARCRTGCNPGDQCPPQANGEGMLPMSSWWDRVAAFVAMGEQPRQLFLGVEGTFPLLLKAAYRASSVSRYRWCARSPNACSMAIAWPNLGSSGVRIADCGAARYGFPRNP